MPEFTVTSCETVKEIPDAKYGPAKVLKLGLQNGDGSTIEAEWFTKAQTPDPAIDSKIEGEIEHDPKWGPKFKKAGAGPPRGGGGFAKSPAQEERIVRQHSAEMALMREANLIAAGRPPFTGGELHSAINWFVSDAYGRSKGGVQIDGMTSDVPIDTSGLE